VARFRVRQWEQMAGVMEGVGGVQEMMWWWWWSVHSITHRGGRFGPKPENRADGAWFQVRWQERTACAMEGVGGMWWW
jgi:hypothetical protein